MDLFQIFSISQIVIFISTFVPVAFFLTHIISGPTVIYTLFIANSVVICNVLNFLHQSVLFVEYDLYGNELGNDDQPSEAVTVANIPNMDQTTHPNFYNGDENKIKAALIYYTDILLKYPNHAGHLLLKIALPTAKTSEQIKDIIEQTFFMQNIISEKDKTALIEDLHAINNYIQQEDLKKLNLTGNYDKISLSRQVYYSLITSITENIEVNHPQGLG